MRILVTGGAGFIGSNFLNLFVPRHPEHTFVCLDKLTYAGNPLSLGDIQGAENFTLEVADVADAEIVTRIFSEFRPDVVVHFAAESHVDRSIHDPGEFVRTNVVGTLQLLNASRALWKGSATGRFHHVSTDEVYGSPRRGDDSRKRADTTRAAHTLRRRRPRTTWCVPFTERTASR